MGCVWCIGSGSKVWGLGSRILLPGLRLEGLGTNWRGKLRVRIESFRARGLFNCGHGLEVEVLNLKHPGKFMLLWYAPVMKSDSILFAAAWGIRFQSRGLQMHIERWQSGCGTTADGCTGGAGIARAFNISLCTAFF